MGTATGAIVLEGRGVARTFGQGALAVRALTPTDIAIRRGEVLVIVGPSGSGKTTLLSILGLVLSPSEGEVWVGGEPVGARDADALALLRRDRVGFVFQQFNLLAGLSALENVEVPLLLRRTPAREQRAAALAALARVGLAARASSKPRLLSGGQQQRVAIARALVTNAAVLLCDEPTASLDGETGRALLSTLRALATEMDRAVVIVTHDERVLGIADRVVEVVDGVARERSDGDEER